MQSKNNTCNNVSNNESLNSEQLKFYYEEEAKKVRDEITEIKISMIILSATSVVCAALVLFLCKAPVLFFIMGGIGVVGDVIMAIYILNQQTKLETLQRERLFLIKR